MLAHESVELLRKYAACPECGNEKVGGGEGTVEIDGEVFKRTCKCGYGVTIDRRIKVVASASRKEGRKETGIYEVRIDGKKPHKFLPAAELKKRAGVRQITQYAKVQEYLNTPEGRKWAVETPHAKLV